MTDRVVLIGCVYDKRSRPAAAKDLTVQRTTVEIHATTDYVAPLTGPLTAAGAVIVLPLRGVDWNDWPGWYAEQ